MKNFTHIKIKMKIEAKQFLTTPNGSAGGSKMLSYLSTSHLFVLKNLTTIQQPIRENSSTEYCAPKAELEITSFPSYLR